MKHKNRKNNGKCEYFTKDGSYCNLICPKVLQGINITYKGCKICGYNLPLDNNKTCKT